MAIFQATQIEENYISVSVTGMNSGFDHERYFKWYKNGVEVPPYTASAAYATETYYTYWNLTPNTTYDLKVEVYDGNNWAYITTLYMSPSPKTLNPASGGKVNIYTQTGWVLATPYIYNGSSWVLATPYVYSGGWRPTS